MSTLSRIYRSWWFARTPGDTFLTAATADWIAGGLHPAGPPPAAPPRADAGREATAASDPAPEVLARR